MKDLDQISSFFRIQFDGRNNVTETSQSMYLKTV